MYNDFANIYDTLISLGTDGDISAIDIDELAEGMMILLCMKLFGKFKIMDVGNVCDVNHVFKGLQLEFHLRILRFP